MKSTPIISIVYIVVGVVVASNHGYLGDLSTLPHVVSGILSVVLWPLLLIGINLHVVF
jgi:hypothetical protein